MFKRKDKLNMGLASHVFVMHDFPIETSLGGFYYEQEFRAFRVELHKLIRECDNINKYIFILNSEIYSSYYLLSERAMERDISRLPCVSVSTVQGYGARDMKKIIRHFIEHHPRYDL